jgi:hypothetical protein
MTHLQTRAPLSVTAVDIPDGDTGTQATIAAMQSLIEDGAKHPDVHELAASILHRARVKPFDWTGEVRAIYNAVCRNVRFTRDVRGKETLREAPVIIRQRIGDCDDHVILLCSLLNAIGHRTRIITVATASQDPSVFTHVYPEVFLEGQWVPIDAARRNRKLGRSPRHWFRKMIWEQPADCEEVGALAGLGLTNVTAPGVLPRSANPRMPRRLRQVLGAYPMRAPGYAPRGQGHYGVSALRGLGDDASDIAAAIPSITVGTADIITAIRANPNNLVPTTSLNQQQSPLSQFSMGSIGGSTWLLLGVLAIGAVVAMRQR